MHLIIRVISVIAPFILAIFIAILHLPAIIKIIACTFCLIICGYMIINIILEEKERTKNKKKIDCVFQQIQRQELHMRGKPTAYINGLGKDPLLKDAFFAGEDFYNKNKFEKAIKEYEKCLTHANANTENKVATNGLIGNCFLSLENYQRALIYYNRAIKLSKKMKNRNEKLGARSDLYINKAIVFGEQRKFKKSLKAINKAIKLSPGYAHAWYTKGITLKLLYKRKEAIKVLDKVIELKPDYADAWYEKGFNLHNLGRHEESLRAFEKAIEKMPKHIKAWYFKTIALLFLDRKEEFWKSGEIYSKLQSEEANALYKHARRYVLEGDKENALRNLSKAVKLGPFSEFKEKARKDEAFKSIWGHEEFKRITK